MHFIDLSANGEEMRFLFTFHILLFVIEILILNI